MPSIVLIRGGGDLATGVALRLIRCGLRIVVTELAQPLAVRRTVSFAEAVFTGEMTIEGFTARRVTDLSDSLRILTILGKQQVPVLVDPECAAAKALHPIVIVDGRMTKRPPEAIGFSPRLYIGLGPGFDAGVNCQAAIETRRGHLLGRVFWRGGPEPDTSLPEGDPRRVLRAPCDGMLIAHANIGDHLEEKQLVAIISNQSPLNGERCSIVSPFKGLLRGLIHPSVPMRSGMKIGDVDPRDDPLMLQIVSDKALAVGGGVLEAILSKPEVRTQLWA